MEKPPFQFGLKAIFTAMTAAAVLLWVVGSLWLGTVESLLHWAAKIGFWVVVVLLGAIAFEVIDRLCGVLSTKVGFGPRKQPPDA